MKAEDARSASRTSRAVGVAFAALLLASCTTSGPIQLANPSFTNSEPGIAGLMADAAASAATDAGVTQGDATSPDAGTASASAEDAAVTSEQDTALPVEVAYVPATNPVAATGAASPAESETAAETPAGEPGQADAGAPAPERFGSPAPEPTQKEKRGFFASLFASPEPQVQPAAVAPLATPAPEAAAEPQEAAAAAPKPQPASATAPAEDEPAEEQKADEEPAAAEPTEVASAEAASPATEKRGFLASFFAPSPAKAAAPAPIAPKPLIAQNVKPKLAAASSKPLVTLASVNPAESFEEDGGLPGVRTDSLFEITRKSGLDDDSDIDLHEDVGGPVQVAYSAGLARLAPNGLLKQRESVDVACLKPSLVRLLKTVERHYGKRMIVTSGYRSPQHNRRVRGARNSMHMYCAAVDVQLPGVSRWELAKFVRAMPGRGGVGTYCHTNSVHIDVGPERDWNWRCRRRK